MNRAKYTQRTEVQELFGHHIQLLQGFYKQTGSPIVTHLEIGLIQTLGYPRTMNDIVPSTVLKFVFLQLFCQMSTIRKIQFRKLDTTILQVLPATSFPYTGPYLKLTFQSSLYQKTSNETTGTGHQYFLHNTLFRFLIHITVHRLHAPIAKKQFQTRYISIKKAQR